MRGLAFMLFPVYPRHLSPAEHGIVALTVTCTVVLGGEVASLHATDGVFLGDNLLHIDYRDEGVPA